MDRNEQETKSVKPLADLLEISYGEFDYFGLKPAQINEETKKKLEEISKITSNAEEEILVGIEVMGHLMWYAGCLHDHQNPGGEDQLLIDGGYFIKNLVELLRGVLSQKDNARYALKSVLEYRLKQGGVQ